MFYSNEILPQEINGINYSLLPWQYIYLSKYGNMYLLTIKIISQNNINVIIRKLCNSILTNNILNQNELKLIKIVNIKLRLHKYIIVILYHQPKYCIKIHYFQEESNIYKKLKHSSKSKFNNKLKKTIWLDFIKYNEGILLFCNKTIIKNKFDLQLNIKIYSLTKDKQIMNKVKEYFYQFTTLNDELIWIIFGYLSWNGLLFKL